MHQAIEKGNKDAIAHWLEKERENVNVCRGGSTNHQHIAVANGTALHWAVYYGQQEIAQLLLNNGAGTSNCQKLLKFKHITIHIFKLVTHRVVSFPDPPYDKCTRERRF